MRVKINQPQIIRPAMLAAACERGNRWLFRSVRLGAAPPPDSWFSDSRSHGWTLPVIAAWRPEIAARCEAMQSALQAIPLEK